MSGGFKKIIANFSYVVLSNLLTVIVSSLVVLILPKIMGVEEYGYWQLYIFYLSYAGFVHLGWVDGIYLRYGGLEYDELDKEKFSLSSHAFDLSDRDWNFIFIRNFCLY